MLAIPAIIQKKFKKSAIAPATPVDLITPGAFNRLVKRDMEFVLIGEQSPVSSVSLDVNDETSLKLTGRIPTK
ncbi:hypothetical protein [Dyadobacter psychrotolerans]|uniref:Uncharacterized protein n=1 Tax=Dyadobacter psychrotolerans TaxID=2541721 RepID=A0A4R5DKW4_9BACT|nr:hypothetical protein [Dyadobacter psychrotolerans]TDE14836.1 hypothetical protein E0F88_16785 [Dyadobacter psychrotolerans]